MASAPRRGIDEERTDSQPGEKARNVAVRRALPADVDPIARMFVRAYMDDPIATWMCRSQDLRARTLYALYSARLRQMLAHGEVWTDSERSCAAAWLSPGARKPGISPQPAVLRCLLNPRLVARLPMLALGMRRMERAHPDSPEHWYLSLLGTDPGCQGRGLASAVLRPVLERCDIDGVGAYLESSKQGNLRFYARHGFQETEVLRLVGGPKIWLMWREPSGSSS